MPCPPCQTDNRAGRKFCAACGQTLVVTCPRCAFVNESEDRFCGGCDQALNLRTPRLHHSFLSAAPVLEVYAALGQRPSLVAL
jgi:hypothetical protein